MRSSAGRPGRKIGSAGDIKMKSRLLGTAMAAPAAKSPGKMTSKPPTSTMAKKAPAKKVAKKSKKKAVKHTKATKKATKTSKKA